MIGSDTPSSTNISVRRDDLNAYSWGQRGVRLSGGGYPREGITLANY